MPVRELRHLKEGDHIKWKKLEGYDHHAIVEYVEHKSRKVHVIEYGTDGVRKGVITRNVVYGVRGMHKYLYDYCYDAYTVLERAMSRLGERKYNLLANNCEHFATWCKTCLLYTSPSPRDS